MAPNLREVGTPDLLPLAGLPLAEKSQLNLVSHMNFDASAWVAEWQTHRT